MFATMLGATVLFSLSWSDAPAAWSSDYSKAVADACLADKPLFIVICPGSSEYARFAALGTFVSDDVERSLKNDYTRVMIDTDTPEGKEMAQKFGVEEGPHFVIIDRSGKWQIFYQSGYLSESKIGIALGKFRRIKLTAAGRPVQEVVRRQVVQLCST